MNSDRYQFFLRATPILVFIFFAQTQIYNALDYPDGDVRLDRLVTTAKLAFIPGLPTLFIDPVGRIILPLTLALAMLFIFGSTIYKRRMLMMMFLTPGFFYYASNMYGELIFIIASLTIPFVKSPPVILLTSALTFSVNWADGFWLLIASIGFAFSRTKYQALRNFSIYGLYIFGLLCILFDIKVSDLQFLWSIISPDQQIEKNVLELENLGEGGGNNLLYLFVASLSAPIAVSPSGTLSWWFIALWLPILLGIKKKKSSFTEIFLNKRLVYSFIWVIGIILVTVQLFPLHANPKHFVIVLPFAAMAATRLILLGNLKLHRIAFCIIPVVCSIQALIAMAFN